MVELARGAESKHALKLDLQNSTKFVSRSAAPKSFEVIHPTNSCESGGHDIIP